MRRKNHKMVIIKNDTFVLDDAREKYYTEKEQNISKLMKIPCDILRGNRKERFLWNLFIRQMS